MSCNFSSICQENMTIDCHATSCTAFSATPYPLPEGEPSPLSRPDSLLQHRAGSPGRRVRRVRALCSAWDTGGRAEAPLSHHRVAGPGEGSSVVPAAVAEGKAGAIPLLQGLRELTADGNPPALPAALRCRLSSEERQNGLNKTDRCQGGLAACWA